MDSSTILCFCIITILYFNTSLYELCGEYVKFGIELVIFTKILYHFWKLIHIQENSENSFITALTLYKLKYNFQEKEILN